MKEIAIIIIGASCIAAVAAFLSHGKHRSLTSGALALLLALFVATPLSAYLSDVFSSDIFTAPDFELDSEDAEYEIVAKEAFLEGIARLVADEFDIDRDDIIVKCDGFDIKDFTYERLYVTLTGGASSADTRGIRFFIEENFSGECRVEIEIG